MEPSALHSQAAVFEEEDNCLYFALGLAHAASQIIAWLEDESILASSASSNFILTIGEQDKQADDLIDFLLGLISFSQHYARSLAIIGADLHQEVPSDPSAGVPTLTSLVIRDLLV